MLWITGANGLLGRSLRAKCKAALHSGREVDIGSFEQVEAFIQAHPSITHIINCAAYTNVDQAEVQRAEAFRINAKGPENLARTKRKLIHISTDYVFSGEQEKPYQESDATDPCNYYGLTKLEGEKRVLDAGACVIRTSWLFGEGGNGFASKLFDLFLKEMRVRLIEDQWSKFTYAPDLADAILHMLDQTGLYQYANQGVATRYEFGMEMMRQAKQVVVQTLIPISAAQFPMPCKRPRYSAMDTGRIESLVNVRSWQEALKEFLCAKQPIFL